MRDDELRYESADAVSPHAAFEAALARAGRTQHALILAEAQILEWKQRYVAEVQRAERLEAEVAALGGRTKVDGGVEDGEGEAGDAADVGEADRAG